MNNNPMTNEEIIDETILAIACVIGEQLDIDRLTTGLKRQYDKYEQIDRPGIERIKQTLFRIGESLTLIAARRTEKNSWPQ